jgi:CDP-6-deoxy-D-xylo-4-hexulose-3-dehydrase
VTGVGGFATTSDPEFAVVLKNLMNHGKDSIYLGISDDQRVSKEKLFEIASKRFSFVDLGHSFRCTELEAALGLGQLEQREAIIRARRENAAYFRERLESLKDRIRFLLFLQTESTCSCFFRLRSAIAPSAGSSTTSKNI